MGYTKEESSKMWKEFLGGTMNNTKPEYSAHGEWEDYTIRMKKDPKWHHHGTDIEFNGVRYVRKDLARATAPASTLSEEEIIKAIAGELGVPDWQLEQQKSLSHRLDKVVSAMFKLGILAAQAKKASDV